MHGLQSFVSTHSEERDKFAFHPLFAIANTFNISVFETEFSYFFRGVGSWCLKCSPLPPGSYELRDKQSRSKELYQGPVVFLLISGHCRPCLTAERHPSHHTQALHTKQRLHAATSQLSGLRCSWSLTGQFCPVDRFQSLPQRRSANKSRHCPKETWDASGTVVNTPIRPADDRSNRTLTKPHCVSPWSVMTPLRPPTAG